MTRAVDVSSTVGSDANDATSVAGRRAWHDVVYDIVGVVFHRLSAAVRIAYAMRRKTPRPIHQTMLSLSLSRSLSRPLPALRCVGARAFTTEVDATKTTPATDDEGPKDAAKATPPLVESWVHNTANEPQSIVELNADVFGQPLRRDILQRVVRWHLAAARGSTSFCRS